MTADEVPYRLRQAYQALRSGRPQPAMVDIREDVAEAALSGPLDYKPVPWVRSAADFGAVREAADLLLRAKLPMIWAGNGILYAQATGRVPAGGRAARRPDDEHADGQERLQRTP